MRLDEAHDILARENARDWREPASDAGYGAGWERQVGAALCAAMGRWANDLNPDMRARARRRRLVTYMLGLLQQERICSGG